MSLRYSEPGSGPTIATELYGSDNVQRVRELAPPTFRAIYDRITPGLNKYFASLMVSSATRTAVIQRVTLYNWNTSAVTGVLLDCELRLITSWSVGTAVTPVSVDTGDSLSSGIIADSNPGSVADSSLLGRAFASSEELIIGAQTFEQSLANGRVISGRTRASPSNRSLTLRWARSAR